MSAPSKGRVFQRVDLRALPLNADALIQMEDVMLMGIFVGFIFLTPMRVKCDWSDYSLRQSRKQSKMTSIPFCQ